MIGCMDQPKIVSDRLSRRGALGILGALGAALAGVPAATAPAAAAPAPSCVLSPAIEEGPFFVDERLNRSDLTGDSTDPGVAGGAPLRLALTVYALHGGACALLPGAQIDLWHASATGLYSDEAMLHTSGQRFLRGYQVTDANGTARFATVFPGWYPGRTPHVHVKVRTFSPARAVTSTFTSQLYFDDAVTNAVIARAPYNTRGTRDTTNARDQIFSSAMVVPLTRSGSGYAGTFNLGLRMG
ncbi:MAG: Intradiol ring-cleavage dioxygenase [Candidatus Eremiobacteraeota bacterium]|nr:Intradiol ring-cleavage dioxygenase [Candidatus Eremiobacteraeota bacterium]